MLFFYKTMIELYKTRMGFLKFKNEKRRVFYKNESKSMKNEHKM